jgi:hypothetical protein
MWLSESCGHCREDALVTEREQEWLLQRWGGTIGVIADAIIKRRGITRSEYDDLVQEGCVALLRVAGRPRREGQATYYWRCIERAMWQWVAERYPLIRIPRRVQRAGIAVPMCVVASSLPQDEMAHGAGEDDPLECGADMTDAMLELIELKDVIARAHLTRREQCGLAAIALGCNSMGYPRTVLYMGVHRAREKLVAVRSGQS